MPGSGNARWCAEGPSTSYAGQIYRCDADSGYFVLVDPQEMQPGMLYYKYSEKYGNYVFITRGDFRPISATGTKFQGWRVGFNGQAGLDWWVIGPGTGFQTLTRASDRGRPSIIRVDDLGNHFVWEVCQDGWEQWGGRLDSPTPPAPTCTLTADPSSITLGNALLLSLEHSGGDMTEAKLDGKPVELRVLKIAKIPEQAGPGVSIAWVRGPGGENQCVVHYEVLPAASSGARRGRI